ncbi:MAG: glycoside hydrolase family 2 TIM barrel-domain containing protein [bacterium]
MNILLSGEWRGRPDPKQTGLNQEWFRVNNSGPDIPEWKSVDVPSCWNADPRYERYEGIFWYATDFDLPGEADSEIAIRFLAVNYLCRAWVNGREIGIHEGGYLPFEFNVPNERLLPGGNRLVVMAENFRSSRRIPGALFDWFNYGGIVRDVELLIRSPFRFKDARVRTSILSDGGAEITVNYQQIQTFPFSWLVTECGEPDKPIASGVIESHALDGSFEIIIPNAKLWSPETPSLYMLELKPAPGVNAENHSVRFGVREIRTFGPRIIFNGKPIKLKGDSLHEELMPYGRSIPREERFRDARDIKKLGFNALRTAHYTHDEALLDAADEIGLLVLEEIPVYWDIDYESRSVYEKAESMLRDMIARDFNHPSVIQWSVGNEVPVENEACDLFIQRLLAEARSLDETRLVTYVSSRFLIDETRKASDVCCVNCYLGWYFGDEKELAGLLTATRETAPDKPWLVTEFGACARSGFRSPKRRSKYSENRQAEFLAHYIRTINGLDWISGWFIWIYRDFKSPMRNHKYQQGFNRKGIVGVEREQKLICEMLPSLLDEKILPKSESIMKFLAPAFKKLEEFAWRFAQPMIARAAKKEYDDFFTGIK